MILDIKNVEKNFGGIKALDSLSLSIKKGTIVAVIGPNGSGKSTLFNVLCNTIEKDSGFIYFEGKDITFVDEVTIARLGILRTFQEVHLFSYLTVQDHLEIALSHTDESLFTSLKKPTDASADLKEILAMVGLRVPLDTLVTSLSYGQRKLLDLSLAIVGSCKLLLLDEPVAGVNPQLRKKIKSILITLKKQGKTILLIEHDMNFVMDLVDDIFVMDYGKVIAHGKPKDIRNNKKVLQAYLGE